MGESGQWVTDPACHSEWIRSCAAVLAQDSWHQQKVCSLAATVRGDH